MLCLVKPCCRYLWPRTRRHIESTLRVREGGRDPDCSWLGKGWRYSGWGTLVLPGHVWPGVPLCALRSRMPKQPDRTCLVEFPAAQASRVRGQKQERRPGIPAGYPDATASLGSANRPCGFHVALQGRHQPLCVPAGAPVSPHQLRFEEHLATFRSNGYFQLVCSAWQPFISSLVFPCASPFSVLLFFFFLQLLLIMLLELLHTSCECVEKFVVYLTKSCLTTPMVWALWLGFAV